MTIATPPFDVPISVDVPDHRKADLFSAIRDPARLASLRRLALLDTPAEQAFDRLTRLAVKIFHAPVALLSLVDGERSFFKSSVGLPEPWASQREIPLSHSVCQHVVSVHAPLVINDAHAHPLVSDNQAVAALRIMAYLGIPLVTSDGHALGTFAVIDTVPREWTLDDVTTLGELAASAMTEIELRAENKQRLLVEQRLHLLESVVGNAAAVLIAEADSTNASDLRIVFVNDSYTRLTGYSPDEVVGKIHQVLNSSEIDRSQIETLRTALATWKPTYLEFLAHRKDGSAFWVESNIVPIADATGQYSHWVIIQRDISAQKASQEALRESEERFRVLTEAIPQIVWTAQPDGLLDYFNQRWFDYTGMTLEQTRGRGWEPVLHPDDLKACVDRWSQAVMTGEPYETKYRFKRATDGAYRWHLGQAMPVRDENGKIVKWFGTCTDITELNEGARRLAVQYACTRIIADSIVMDETIPKILHAICENLGWTLGQMWQLDPRGGCLRCVAAWHEPAAAVTAFADLSRKITFSPGMGLPGRVWANCGPDWESDVTTFVNFPRAEEAKRCGLHSGFAFPILHGKKVLGVMEFFHKSMLKPDEPLLAMVAAVGSQVGQFMERMQTEEARQRSEERYRSLVLTSSQIVWITDGAGQLLLEDSSDWSTWLTFSGQTAEQAQGSGWLDAIHPDDRVRTAEGWNQALASKSFYQIEYRIRTATGEYRHTVARGVPVIDADGHVREWIGSNTDITEQKHAEEMLKEANQKLEARVVQRTAELSEANEFLKALLENIQDGIVACDSKGDITLFNKAVRKFHGLAQLPLDDNQLTHQLDLYHSDGLTPMATDEIPLHRAFRGERIQNVEIVIAPLGGVARTLLASGRAFYDGQGNKLGAVVSLNDITERKRADEAHAFLAAIVESSQDAIISKTLDGTIVSWNLGAERLYGYTAEEIVGKPISILFPPGHDDELKWIIEQIARGERISQYETVRLRKDGSWVDVAVTISAVKSKDGQITVASNIAHDITEHKRAQRELLKAHEELEQRVKTRTAELALAKEAAEAANRAKSEFFSRMSHELRTPLNVILGFGQLLEMDALSDPQRESAEQIGKGGRHLLALINEVLDIARIEAGGTGMMSPEKVDVGEVVGEILGMIQPLADAAGVRILLPEPRTCEGVVRADLQRLKQVLLNLLSNGIKYNQRGGTLTISCKETADAMLRISVTDTGPGIAPYKMHRLFVAFDRLDAEKKGVEGTGLGLTLAKGLVEAMQGKIGAESTVGKGSTFWVELARIDTTAEPLGENLATTVVAVETSTTTGIVLCVEDNPANFRLIERILKLRPRVRLLSATQGQLGIDLARQHRPDVIFLDLHLPDIQGDEVLRQLQSETATHDIPVIMLSADATPHQVERLRAAGATRYMVKPLDVKEFLQILDETLQRGER